MKEQILQWVRDYAPVVLMFIMCFIDRFGFISQFLTFKNEVNAAINLKKLKKEFEEIKGDLRSTIDELKDCKSAMVQLEESLSRVKGAKK